MRRDPLQVVLLLAAAGPVCAQDARAMLASIGDAVRAAGSVRVEGVIEDDPAGGPPVHFELTTQGPWLMRYQTVSGGDRVLQVCDGTSRWDYREPALRYKRDSEFEGACAPPVGIWQTLPADLVSATIEGRTQECETIKAVFKVPRPLMAAFPAGGNLDRTLCVDPARRVILRERLEYPAGTNQAAASHYSMTITYSRVDYGPPQPAEFFQFQPPAGSHEGGVNLPLTGEGGSYAGPAPQPASFRAPMVAQRTQPQYTPEALRAQLQGTVTISLVVGPDGRPRNLKVVRALGMGLDEKAVEAVSSWKFKPGKRNGEAVAVPMTVEVPFRLP